ncbi:unnamed protein product [Brassicogethes aeneus]|uniref:DUF659 domain-containing protein n=1 Tax=Brassicogethes aeneus TaxID=1431903 RepID=A0A9P0B0Q6_BRAAE|nr:unnamed protein product [Brassicogethes aeneus]
MDSGSESSLASSSISTASTSTFSSSRLCPLREFIDKTSNDEKKRFDKKLARAIYSSGSPIQMVEKGYWKEFFKAIKPSYTLPSRHDLSHKLLDAEYETLQGDVMTKIRTAETVSVQCDGWSNIRNEAVLKFVVTTPKPVLLKTMTTGAESHTGEYIAQELGKCITEIGPGKIMAIVSDNAAAMEKAKQIIATQFNYITIYSCVAHSLNLLVGDIMKLNSFRNVESSCKEIIKEINGSHKNLACFNKIQLDKYHKVRSLKLPVKTRWGSILYCVESLILTKEALQILIVSQDSKGVKFSKNVRDHILENDIFWVRLDKLKGILSPIVKWITVLEGDAARISQVFIAISEIEGYIYKDNVKSLLIKSNEEKELTSLFNKRRDRILKPIHLAAYLLDPSFNQSELELNNEQHITAMQFIDNLISNHPQFQEHKETIILELTNYLGRNDIWSINFVWESAKKSDCITWWKGICNKTKLKNVAVAILGLPPSTAATERSFSTSSFIHCKKKK